MVKCGGEGWGGVGCGGVGWAVAVMEVEWGWGKGEVGCWAGDLEPGGLEALGWPWRRSWEGLGEKEVLGRTLGRRLGEILGEVLGRRLDVLEGRGEGGGSGERRGEGSERGAWREGLWGRALERAACKKPGRGQGGAREGSPTFSDTPTACKHCC